MIDLRPCPGCRRHVGVDEAVCPFCSAAMPSEPPAPPRAIAGRLTRAAIFAGAVATGACGSSEPKANGPGGGGDQVIDNQMPADAGTADEVMLSSPADAAPIPDEVDEERDWRERRRQTNPNDVPMPYGAPPVRQRLV